MVRYDHLYIDGHWVRPLRGGTFETLDPALETPLAQVAAATA